MSVAVMLSVLALAALPLLWSVLQRGHGDVDLTTTYKFDDDQYVFAFREFLIPVASVFFYNFQTMRSTGKFLGITGEGRIANNRAGAKIRKVSMMSYRDGEDPV